ENIIERVPETCTVVLLWLPLSGETQRLVENTPILRESRDVFRSTVTEMQSPKLALQWRESSGELDLLPKNYSNDGIHFTRPGGKKVAQHIGGVIHGLVLR
ncbi:MAG: hypothetical protein VCD00_04355, partial [Candidatus Hydrogenedentota bacterium]